jgi:hypothetical protein
MRQDWKEIEKAYLTESFKSDTEFIARHNLPPGTFHYHKKQFNKKLKQIDDKSINYLAKNKSRLMEKYIKKNEIMLDKGMEALDNGCILDKDGGVDAYKGAIIADLASKNIAKVLFDDKVQGANIQINIMSNIPQPETIEVKESVAVE